MSIGDIPKIKNREKRNGMILLWNEGARRIYGYAAEEVVGKMNSNTLHVPEDVESGRAAEIMRIALEEGKYEGVWKRRRKTGEVFTARLVMTLRRDNKGKPIGYLIISKDITKEEKLNQKLVESQEYNRGLIESNIDALVTTDTVGIITDVNRQMEELTRFPREKLIGTPFKNYFTDPARGRRHTAGAFRNIPKQMERAHHQSTFPPEPKKNTATGVALTPAPR